MKSVLIAGVVSVFSLVVGCASAPSEESASAEGAASTHAPAGSSANEVENLNRPGTTERKELMDTLRGYFTDITGQSDVEFKVDEIADQTPEAMDQGDVQVSVEVRLVKPGTMEPYDLTAIPAMNRFVDMRAMAAKGQFAKLSGVLDRNGGEWSAFTLYIDDVNFVRDGDLDTAGQISKQ